MTTLSSHTSRARSWTGKRGPRKFEARWLDSAGVVRAAKGSRATGRFVPFETKTAAAGYAAEQAGLVAKTLSGERGDERPATLNELLDRFLAQHDPPDPATKKTLEQQLKHARGTCKRRDETSCCQGFGNRDPETIRRSEIKAWRKDVSGGMRHYAFRALRQALTWAATEDPPLLSRNPSDGIENPKRGREERRPMHPFDSWEEIEAVADELAPSSPVYAALVIVMGRTGLRPEEAFALHRSHIDYAGPLPPGVRGRIHVQQRYTRGTLKSGTKTGGDRFVPFGERVERALRSLPPRIDTPILFPTPNGKYVDADAFRSRVWLPALRGAGLGHRILYDLRHTCASLRLGEDVPSAKLAMMMGTSISQFDSTYHHYLRSDDRFGADNIGQAVGE